MPEVSLFCEQSLGLSVYYVTLRHEYGPRGQIRTDNVIINLWEILSLLRFNQFRHTGLYRMIFDHFDNPDDQLGLDMNLVEVISPPITSPSCSICLL